MTTSRPRFTILSQAMITKKGSRECAVCNNDIEVNENIVAKRSHSFKWYHIKCAERVNIV
jgi:hypothetical protein